MTKEQLAKLGITTDKDEVSEEEAQKLIETAMAGLRSDVTKHKNLLSERNSEISALKKEKEGRMSDDEKQKLYIETLEKENASFKRASARNAKVADYISLGYSKELAEKIADAELDGKPTVELHKQFITAREETIKAELLKGSKQPNVNGNTGAITKEDAMKMGYEERVKLLQEHPEQYNEFFGKKEN